MMSFIKVLMNDTVLIKDQKRAFDQSYISADGDGEEDQPISKTGRLFLRNLPYQATEADLADLFEDFGELSEVHLVVDRLPPTPHPPPPAGVVPDSTENAEQFRDTPRGPELGC
jgi:RNA recognition motif-containing protein